MRLIKKMDGAISIFLCLVLTSLIILSGFLIDGSRIRAGETQAQAAAENSMRSTLAGYNRMLKDLYGLFAISDGSAEALNEEIEAYMNKTLMTELGISKETMGEQMYSYLTSLFTGSGSSKNVSFLNLFDYGVEELQSESLYNLAQTEVLKKQIIDYMKYRGPRELTEGFVDKLEIFKGYGKQSGTMKKKIQLDKDFDKIRKYSETLSDLIEDINNFSTEVGGGRIDVLYRSLIDSISEKAYLQLLIQREEDGMKALEKSMTALAPSLESAQNNVMQIEEQISMIAQWATPDNISQLQPALNSLGMALSSANEALRAVETQYQNLKELYDKSLQRCEQYKAQIKVCTKNAAQIQDNVTELINVFINKCTEAEYQINRINDESQNINSKIKDINSKDLNGEKSDFANSIRLDLADKSNLVSAVKLSEVKQAILENKEILRELKSILSTINYSGINGIELPGKLNKDRESISEADILSYTSNVLKYQDIVNLLGSYRGRCNSRQIPYMVKKLNNTDSSVSDPRNNLQGLIDNTSKNTSDLSDNTELQQKSTSEPDDSDLISKSAIIKKDYSKEDAEFINKLLKGYQNLKSSENGVDDTGTDEYGIDQLKSIIGNADFKNNEESFSSSGMEFLEKIGELLKNSLEGMRDSMYINEYVMGVFKNNLTQNTAHGNLPEKDFSGILKSRRNTWYDAEVEYILSGMKNQQKNTYAVEVQILLVRFALNTLAIYMDSEKVTQALVTAEAIAGITVFGVPIIQTMILLGWAMAEAVTDVKLIMDGGKVSLYKIKGDWFLDSTTVFKDFAKAAAGQAGKAAIDFGESRLEDLTENAIEKIDKMLEKKVSNVVDKAFAPLELGINSSGGTLENLSKEVLNNVDTIVEESQSNTYLELQKYISDLAEEEFNAVRGELEAKIKDATYEGAFKILNTKKESIKNYILSRVSGLTGKLKTEVNDAAAKGADGLKEYLSTSLGGVTMSDSGTGGTLLSSMTAMGYQDYLRLFLLMRNNKTKLSRIADLIQLNMRKESDNSEFNLENCNTYIRLKTTVSMKYLFMTSAFIPDKLRFDSNKRHRISLLIYQGY